MKLVIECINFYLFFCNDNINPNISKCQLLQFYSSNPSFNNQLVMNDIQYIHTIFKYFFALNISSYNIQSTIYPVILKISAPNNFQSYFFLKQKSISREKKNIREKFIEKYISLPFSNENPFSLPVSIPGSFLLSPFFFFNPFSHNLSKLSSFLFFRPDIFSHHFTFTFLSLYIYISLSRPFHLSLYIVLP